MNGRFLSRRQTGVDRFASELMRAWLSLHGESRDVTMAMPRRKASTPEYSQNELSSGIEVKYGRLEGHLWEQIELPRTARDSVLLNLCNSGPLGRLRQLAVLHDVGVLATPHFYSFAYRNWHRVLMTGLMKRAAVIATVSKFSADDITRRLGKRSKDIELIYEGGEHILREAPDRTILERLNLGAQRFVLVVGSISPNKNLANVVRAAEMIKDMGVRVVAAGGSNTRVFAGADGETGTLVRAGYVSNGELRALYEAATCFLFPSYYEGFGLPPLEAMHCGCPVIVSNRASMPEICGNAAAYCKPEDPADIAAQLRKILRTSSLRQEMREQGFQQARKFSWTAAAGQLEEIMLRNFH